MSQVPWVSRYFVAYLTSLVVVAPFFRTGDPLVTSRIDKFFAEALDTLANVDNKTLSAYLHRKATAWFQLFPLVQSPDGKDDTQKVLVKNHKGPKELDAGNVDDVVASRPIMILSEA